MRQKVYKISIPNKQVPQDAVEGFYMGIVSSGSNPSPFSFFSQVYLWLNMVIYLVQNFGKGDTYEF